MIDLSTDYLGLKLKNPLVPSASPLSKNLDTALRLEDAGAAALVMYSLFEEELQAEDAMLDRFLLHADLGHGEADGFLPDQGEFQGGLERYLSHLHQLKRRLEIPVVASLNGVSPSGWVELGRALEQAGADALELNVYHVAADMQASGAAGGGALRRVADRTAPGGEPAHRHEAVALLFLAAAFRAADRTGRRAGGGAVQPLLPAGHRSRRTAHDRPAAPVDARRGACCASAGSPSCTAAPA